MKTRRQHRRRRGGTRKVQFSNNIPFHANNTPALNMEPGYLNELQTMVRRQVPTPSEIQQNDAEIMAAVIESQNSPENMGHAFKLIYSPEPLTEAEYAIANPLVKRRGYGAAINTLEASPLPTNIRDKIIRYLRYVRAIRKVKNMFLRKNASNPRFIHEEWGPNKN